MDLLQQCAQWFENDEHQKIVDAIEALPEEERTPELDSELARAYNNVAEATDRKLFRKAVALLKRHESYFEGDHRWNFRLGYAYYYLDQEGRALHHFREALAALPGDEDTQNFIDDCERRISLPRFAENLRERTESVWKRFAAEEAELRRIMDEDTEHVRGDELIEKCGDILREALENQAFELGFNGEKYELILTPEGSIEVLLEDCYFQRHVPAEVAAHWNILVGRQRMSGLALDAGEGPIRGEDVQVWLEAGKGDRYGVKLYCEKMLPLLTEDEGRVWWLLTTLTDQLLGELVNMRYIRSFDVLETPAEGTSCLLSELPEELSRCGAKLDITAEEVIAENYTFYSLDPSEDPDADYRLDTISGASLCPTLVSEYLQGEDRMVNELQADGAVAGFFIYPLAGFRGENRSEEILALRDRAKARMETPEGAECCSFIGGATGLFDGYLDFIAWDFDATVRHMRDFFETEGLPWLAARVFRRDARPLSIYDKEDRED